MSDLENKNQEAATKKRPYNLIFFAKSSIVLPS